MSPRTSDSDVNAIGDDLLRARDQMIQRLQEESEKARKAFLGILEEQKQTEEELRIHRDHLEKLVKERTEKLSLVNQELRARTEELESFNKAMIAREFRMIELKEEVNTLCRRLGIPEAYPPIWHEESAPMSFSSETDPTSVKRP